MGWICVGVVGSVVGSGVCVGMFGGLVSSVGLS